MLTWNTWKTQWLIRNETYQFKNIMRQQWKWNEKPWHIPSQGNMLQIEFHNSLRHTIHPHLLWQKKLKLLKARKLFVCPFSSGDYLRMKQGCWIFILTLSDKRSSFEAGADFDGNEVGEVLVQKSSTLVCFLVFKNACTSF